MDGWVVIASEFGLPLVQALLLAIGTWIAARLARSSFKLAARRTDAHARVLIGRIINIVIVGLGVATILDTLGVPLTTFVTVLGVAGLGISLAMQDVLKSFVAGTFLLFERPFRIGDEISIKDQRGVVEDIGIRTTRLRNADNVQIIIPNAVVFSEMLANRTNEVKPAPAAPPTVDTAADAATGPVPLPPDGIAPGSPAAAPGTSPPAPQPASSATPPAR